MLFLDNWQLLHGRKALSGTHRMAGDHLHYEDFESRLRMPAPQPLNRV